jgi:hypothetical protein
MGHTPFRRKSGKAWSLGKTAPNRAEASRGSTSGPSVDFGARLTEFHKRRTPASRPWGEPACLVLIFCALLLAPAAYPLDEGYGVVAVYSAVSPAYTRTAQPDGSFKPETYAFGEGGNEGGALKDFTIDNLHFIDVAQIIAPALAKKNYLPAKDAQQTGLLIMVYWGTTSSAKDGASQSLYQNAQGMLRPALPPQPKKHSHEDTLKSGDGAAMEVEQNAITSAIDQMVTITGQANRLREKQDLENARALGYLPEFIRLKAYQGTVLHAQDLQDLVDEVEEARYYVVLLAYDFQLLLKNKQRKMLWETRFSIRERHNDFGKGAECFTLFREGQQRVDSRTPARHQSHSWRTDGCGLRAGNEEMKRFAVLGSRASETRGPNSVRTWDLGPCSSLSGFALQAASGKRRTPFAPERKNHRKFFSWRNFLRGKASK